MSVYLRVLAGPLTALLMPALAHAALAPAEDGWRTAAQQQVMALVQTASPRAPVRLAQAADMTYRVGQLEERIRVLNGRIEELSFQLLEMQEAMRRMQEDNEFRFQEIEGGTAGGRSDAGDGTPERDEQTAAAPVTVPSGDRDDATGDQNAALSEAEDPSRDDTQTASLPASESEELYRAAYGYVLSGDYRLAQTGFQDFIAQYPDSRRVPDAHFWLGEALYSQGEYHEAAKTLLTAHKQFPDSPKSPEMLLKLGMSLAALDNRDTACATYREVLTRYPQATDAVKAKVAVEQSRMSC